MVIPPAWFGLENCKYGQQMKVNPNQIYIILEKIYGGGLGQEFDPYMEINYEIPSKTADGVAIKGKEKRRVSQFSSFFSELYKLKERAIIKSINTSTVPIHDVGEIRVGEYSRMPFISADFSRGILEIKGAKSNAVDRTKRLIELQWYYGL